MLNFPIPSFTLCQKKRYITKGIKRFWKTFLLLKDVENRYLGGKFHERSYFSFGIAQWKLFSSGKNLKFPTFKLYTVSEKTLYHQRYSTDFQKLSFCWKMWKIGIWAEKIMSAAILVLQRKNAISPKVFNRFSRTSLLLKDVENRYLGRNDHERSNFSFAMARW